MNCDSLLVDTVFRVFEHSVELDVANVIRLADSNLGVTGEFFIIVSLRTALVWHDPFGGQAKQGLRVMGRFARLRVHART